MRRGTNKCGWLLLGRKENCGRPCVGELCAMHNYKLKNGANIPAPCQVCGVGVKCDYRLCRACGGNLLRNRLSRKERKARQLFDRVMQELVVTNLTLAPVPLESPTTDRRYEPAFLRRLVDRIRQRVQKYALMIGMSRSKFALMIGISR